MVRVEELLEQGRRVLIAKRDCGDAGSLYQDETRLANGFFEIAHRKYLEERQKLKALILKATPEVLSEARRREGEIG